MSIKKRYFKTKPLCTLAFRLDSDVGKSIDEAAVVGDFNDWDTSAGPMKRLRDGSFKVDIQLQPGRGYPFRYLMDNGTWTHDPQAGKFVPTPFHDAQNSVVSL
jgi:1,4-alpha-glucan branching enzyme